MPSCASIAKAASLKRVVTRSAAGQPRRRRRLPHRRHLLRHPMGLLLVQTSHHLLFHHHPPAILRIHHRHHLKPHRFLLCPLPHPLLWCPLRKLHHQCLPRHPPSLARPLKAPRSWSRRRKRQPQHHPLVAMGTLVLHTATMGCWKRRMRAAWEVDGHLPSRCPHSQALRSLQQHRPPSARV